MKNRFVIAIATVLVMLLFGGMELVSAATTGCNLDISLINQDPNPAIPNSYVKVVFEVSGVQDTACNGAAVKFKQEYPFSLDPDYDPVQSIQGGTYTKDYKTTWVVPYKLRVANDALEGDYQIKLLYHPGNDKGFENFFVKSFNLTIIDVQTSFDLVIQEVSGTQASIGIVNTGKNTANSLVVNIPKQENFGVSGTAGQIVGNLAAGDYTIATFSLIPTISRNMTRMRGESFGTEEEQILKVQLDYTDGIGKRRSVVKEVLFPNSLMQGNLTQRRMVGQTGMYGAQNNSPALSTWLYIIGSAALVVIATVGYKKYAGRKRSYSQGSGNLSKIGQPDWVTNDTKTRPKK